MIIKVVNELYSFITSSSINLHGTHFTNLQLSKVSVY